MLITSVQPSGQAASPAVLVTEQAAPRSVK